MCFLRTDDPCDHRPTWIYQCAISERLKNKSKWKMKVLSSAKKQNVKRKKARRKREKCYSNRLHFFFLYSFTISEIKLCEEKKKEKIEEERRMSIFTSYCFTFFTYIHSHATICFLSSLNENRVRWTQSWKENGQLDWLICQLLIKETIDLVSSPRESSKKLFEQKFTTIANSL